MGCCGSKEDDLPELIEVAGAGMLACNGVYRLSTSRHGGPGDRPVWVKTDDASFKVQWSTMSGVWMIDKPGAAPYKCPGHSDRSVPLDATWARY